MSRKQAHITPTDFQPLMEELMKETERGNVIEVKRLWAEVLTQWREEVRRVIKEVNENKDIPCKESKTSPPF